jgi:polyisoprenoid-binding protein YceI
MKTIIITLLAVLPFLGSSQSLTIKSDAVKITFVADMQNTSGSVSGFNAKILFNLDDLSNSMIQGNVDVNTLETGNAKRDEHLKSADYFEAEKYPTMSFGSISIVQKGDAFIMKGKMKIKDVEREETIRFTYKDKVFKGEGTIQAAHYNIGDYASKKPEKTNVKISFLIPVQ